jgi:stage V sporulation protein SpoVS
LRSAARSASSSAHSRCWCGAIATDVPEFGAPDYAGAIRDAGTAEIYALGAGFYVALVKNKQFEAATEFAEWFFETFDLDLES